MPRISLISDSHGRLHKDVLSHLSDTDEIWHAGDLGEEDALSQMYALNKPIRAIWGNIDTLDLRRHLVKDLIFDIEGLKVLMTHIGGYPGKYQAAASKLIKVHRPDIFVCGHSHILKVMRDPEYGHLHLNPGAVGFHGFHKFRTLLRFDIADGKLANLCAIELGMRTSRGI